MDILAATVERTRQLYRGRSFVVADGAVVSAVATARRILDSGGRALAIGASRGTGEVDETVDAVDLGARSAASMMAGIRADLALLQSLSPEVLRRLDTFDPERQARVLLPFYATTTEIAERRVWGARDAAWLALEDKCRIDAFWDEVGIPRAPSIVCPCDLETCLRHARDLDEGTGTAWVADNTEGWHGGGELLRWVRSAADGRQAHAELSPHADSVRIMPFLEGIPCSIHGIVFPDHVLTLRPVEMVVLRRRDSLRLHYAQAASFWEPEACVHDEMREIARRVGAHLRSKVGYRGAFTVDGVVTAGGFRPTELNPRYGAALSILTRGITGLSLVDVHMALIEGVDVDWQPQQLEPALLEASRRQRRGGGMATTRRSLEPETTWWSWRDGWNPAPQDDADAKVSIGPSAMGSIVLIDLRRAPVGPHTAPRIAALLNRLDEQRGLGLGHLDAAPAVG